MKLTKTKHILKCIIILIVIILFCQACKALFKKNPNIIIISVDTLRPDHLGCYGYERDTSPNLDKFAEESILFENCFSHAPQTAPSCVSFLSGFLPHETKVVVNNSKVHSGVPMIAKILKKAGYKTYGVVCNFVLREGKGYEQGFDIYNAQMEDRELNRKNIHERIAEKATQCCIDILKQHSEGNFFLWLHYQDPHGPYTPNMPYNKMFLDHGKDPLYLKFDNSVKGRGGIPTYQRLQENNDYHYYVSQYDGEICYFDKHFGQLIDFLKEIHIYDNSVIIFTSDHGEAMGEHNYYFAHGHAVTNDLIHVPLIVKYPNAQKGIRKDYVQHLDIVPTILKIADIKATFPYRGRDLLKQHSQPVVIFSELSSYNFSVISEGLKLMVYGQNTYLFNINKDFFEKKNYVRDPVYKNHINLLGRHLVKFTKEDLLGPEIIEEKPKLSEQERERLRSLGYIATETKQEK